MNSIFLTDSYISKDTGGGVVSYNILEALKNYSNVVSVMGNFSKEMDSETDTKPNIINLNSAHYNYPPDPPFFKDYLAYNFLPDIPIHLCVTYACPFGLTTQTLKNRGFCKIIADIAPHSIELSKEEHEKLLIEKPIEERYPYPHLKDPWLWKLYSKHLRIADAVVTHSKKGAEYIKKKAELDKQPYIIPHGVYVPEVEPDLPMDKIRVGYFGAIGLDKGFHYLYILMKQIKYNFFVGGKGTLGLKQDPDITVIGPVDDLADFYKNVNVGVFPSVTEGFNICALEAMAYGRPVIVSDWVGMADYIKDGEEGFVVPIRNPQAIYDKLNYFNENPSEVKRMGRNARLLAKRFTWDFVQELYKDCFDEVMM